MKTTLLSGRADCAPPNLGPRAATARSQAAAWEYKVAIAQANAVPDPHQFQDEFLARLRKHGWLFIGGDQGIYYLKRPKRESRQPADDFPAMPRPCAASGGALARAEAGN